MSPEATSAPPEADVIKLARKAAGMTAESAAQATKDRAEREHRGKGISATYWRDVERGEGGRRGQRVKVRASDQVLAAMAREVGVTAEQLRQAGRSDAAQVMEAIDGRAEAVPARTDWLPILQADEEQIGSWERQVWSEVADALARYGEHATGAQVFPGRPEAERLAWDTDAFRTSLDTDERQVRERRVRFIAKLRMVIDQTAQSQQTG